MKKIPIGAKVVLLQTVEGYRKGSLATITNNEGECHHSPLDGQGHYALRFEDGEVTACKCWHYSKFREDTFILKRVDNQLYFDVKDRFGKYVYKYYKLDVKVNPIYSIKARIRTEVKNDIQ